MPAFHPVDVAITRELARSLAACELTFLDRRPIDLQKAEQQHHDYCSRLAALGVEVVRLPADEAQPDCCFVEDTAVVLDEIALLASLGAPARRGETPVVEAELQKHRPLRRIELPATLDGGDVLVVGKTVMSTLSTRTNAAGLAALRSTVEHHGYSFFSLPVSGCLHLKSAVTALDDETLLAHRPFVDLSPLGSRFSVVDVAAGEAAAANVLRVRDEVWADPAFPRTFATLQARGVNVVGVENTELAKAEGALTCKSLLLRRL